VTTLYSLAPMFSLARLLGSLLGFAAAAVSVLYVTTASEAHRLLHRFFLACSIVVGVTAIGALALPHSITWQTPVDGLDPSYVAGQDAQGLVISGIDRFRGFFGNANDVGALMLAAVSSSLACWKLSSRRQRYVLILVIVAAVIVAVCADSRSALGALLVGCALYILRQYRVRGALAIGVTSILVVAALSLIHGAGAYASRDLDTLTGRTDIWAFTLQQIRERPFTGYGYEVSGEIFASRYFPLWYGPWDMGPRSSLHDGYLAHLVGVGVPATALWLFIVLRPWVFVFRQTSDPWNLKSVAVLTVIPALVYNFTEAALPDFFGLNGFFFGLTWALAERYRLQAIERQQTAKEQAFESLPPAVQAFE
jgi:O-antigen ligase